MKTCVPLMKAITLIKELNIELEHEIALTFSMLVELGRHFSGGLPSSEVGVLIKEAIRVLCTQQ